MERSVGKVFAFAGCLLLGVGLKERSGLIHSVGRYGSVRLRAWTLRDSGRFPLTPQKNAKDGELRTQLAALRQVSAAIQRILLRAKRKPAPGIRRSVPGVSPPLIGMGGLFLPWKGKKAQMFGMWGDEEV